MNVKNCIDKSMLKILKSIKLPKQLQRCVTAEVYRVDNKACYCVLLENITVSVVPIEMFYTTRSAIIKNHINSDLDKHINKVYKTLCKEVSV